MPKHDYTQLCRNEMCGGGGWNRRYRHKDGVVCKKCYMRLPYDLRMGLWWKSGDRLSAFRGRIAFALNWLDENPEE